MATPFTIIRLTALPATLEANALYVVNPIGQPVGQNDVELTFTGNTASAVAKSYSRTAAKEDIEEALAGNQSVFIFENIAQKNAEVPLVDAIGYVKDTTGDPEVNGTSAFYVYQLATGLWTLATSSGGETEVSWEQITGGPTASPEAIDQAVADSHTHLNQDVLDKLSVSEENTLMYDGELVSPVTVTAQW